MITIIVAGFAILAILLVGTSVHIVKEYERGVVFRLGRLRPRIRGPGLALIAPIVDGIQKVNMQIATMPVPAQHGITRDNVSVRVDAVVYFRIVDPVRAVVNVQDYEFAVGQVAQTSLRSIIGKSDLDELLSNAERLDQDLELMIENRTVGWGVQIDRIEIKDVTLPESMQRAMSLQAEAERERRARVLTAEGELQATETLARAAAVLADTPEALQLRLLEAVVAAAAEKNSTVIIPFATELLRFLERSAEPETRPRQTPGSLSLVANNIDIAG